MHPVSLAWALTINVLSPFILHAQPYNWRLHTNILANTSKLTGDLVVHGCVGGWLIVTFPGGASRMLEPSILKKVHFLVIPALVVLAGLLSFGFGAERHLDWTSL